MIRRVLIANRGEIAVRVIRGCRALNIEAVAIYSDADMSCLHVKLADRACRIGPSEPSESYLKIDSIVRLAKEYKVEAIHPGYGFLSENADFARACEEAGVKFIGPSSRTLDLTGNKLACRRRLKEVGIKVLPGGLKLHEDEGSAMEEAEWVGFPVLLKSAFGGGGRGIRIARNSREFSEHFNLAQMESKTAFGRVGVYVEKFVQKARHIEFQILADEAGHVIHLGERECSIQRRYQKLLEFSPSPVLNGTLRETMSRAAVIAAEAMDYTNAGTVEFLLDSSDGRFYFNEINARLQVEHPVSEMVTGLDLVQEQLKIASELSLDFGQDDVEFRGAAIECRINAEDPFNDFSPSAGRISSFHAPGGPGVRMDTAIYEGYTIPVFYDSLVAKLITSGWNFDEAVKRMTVALGETVIEGVATTIPFHRLIMEDKAFQKGRLTTDFIADRRVVERLMKEREEQMIRDEEYAAIAAAVCQSSGWRHNLKMRILPADSKQSRWRAPDYQKSLGWRGGWYSDAV